MRSSPLPPTTPPLPTPRRPPRWPMKAIPVFSVVFFRHLPKLHQGTDALVLALRGLLLVGSLFALFYSALELERLGRGFEGTPQN
jgi:hypothetical protein